MTSDSRTNAGKHVMSNKGSKPAIHKRFRLVNGPNDIVLYDVTSFLPFIVSKVISDG